MKIGLVSSAVPHVSGGYRFIVDWLEPQLLAAGHKVERIWLPGGSDPQTVLSEMVNFRMMDLAETCDRVICFRPPAHALKHPHKILWFIHHERIFYDLWNSEYNTFPKSGYWAAYRQRVIDADTRALSEAKQIFANSKVVADRVKSFNKLQAEVLYPPVMEPQRFHSGAYGDELLFVSRVEHHKRQHLAIEAVAKAHRSVKLRIVGACSQPDYARKLSDLVKRHGLQRRVTLDLRWISEQEKIEWLSRARGVVYIPVDEDSYGYPVLEAAHSHRPIITVSDAGGVLEFVQNGRNGLVAEPNATALAAAFNALYASPDIAGSLGQAAERRVEDLGIQWDSVVRRLTS